MSSHPGGWIVSFVQHGDDHCLSVGSESQRIAERRVGAGRVSVEAEYGCGWVQGDDGAELGVRQLPARLGDRTEPRRNTGLYRGDGDGEGVKGAFDHPHLAMGIGRRRKGPIEIDGLVVCRGSGWVLVFRPARVADITTNEPADVVPVSERDEDALAVEVGESGVTEPTVGEAGVDELVVSERLALQGGDESVWPGRGVAGVWPTSTRPVCPSRTAMSRPLESRYEAPRVFSGPYV
jgi:hypothetical protein